MLTPDIKENILIKTEQAQNYALSAFELCVDFAREQNPKILKKLGGYMGDFVNNLRSALNYAMGDYCTQRGFKTNQKGKTINTDFPYAFNRKNFDRIEVVSLMSKSDPGLYKYMEEIQPYQSKKSPIGIIMTFSNMDKHKILIEVQNMDINTFHVIEPKSFFQPVHWGKHVLVGFSDDKKPILIETPCYIPSLRMFALSNGKWLNFMLPVEKNEVEKEHYLEFIPFINNTANRTKEILNEFYSKWE